MSETNLFSREAWDRNANIYETIRTMPFNAQLASGSLSEARFKHYITQDAHYLIGFGRALTLAAAKAPDPERVVQFAKAAEGALVVERALHGSFFKQYGITPQVFAQTPLSPACHTTFRIFSPRPMGRATRLIVFGEAHLRRILGRYAAYYNESRIHRSLDKDAPFHRAIERFGVITSQPVLGGLHHQYCRI